MTLEMCGRLLDAVRGGNVGMRRGLGREGIVLKIGFVILWRKNQKVTRETKVNDKSVDERMEQQSIRLARD